MARPSGWSWDFGDGTSSTEQHPTHVYGATGHYTVTLTVSNEFGADTVIEPYCVNVTARVDGGKPIYLPLIFKNSR